MSNIEFTDVMVDLETTGTRPDRNAILQIAAVKFNLETGDVDATDMFDRCLTVPGFRSWDLDTLQWWMKDKRDILERLQARAEDPFTVIQAFSSWVGIGRDKPMKLWAKPTHFEYPFIESYCKDFGVHNPLHYRFAEDCNSWVRGSGVEIKDADIEFTGVAHDAIFDVLHQIKWILEVQKVRKGKITC